VYFAVTDVRYQTTTIDPPMIKYDDIWLQAEEVALQLKTLGYTPQGICTAIAKQFFDDTLVETLSCHLNP
jgi:hypothetical protein